MTVNNTTNIIEATIKPAMNPVKDDAINDPILNLYCRLSSATKSRVILFMFLY